MNEEHEPVIRIEGIFGTFPQVSTAPTWTPKKFQDGFAYYKNGSTYRFYIYMPNDNSWHYIALT